tara:strand:+ start:263 stop:466 length:204 start_codon:yes stop_codon:yes gene_type:complete
MSLAVALNWIGAAALAAAPFFITYTWGQVVAITGLSLLTRQAIINRTWNLVFLNITGIIGYSFTILT